MKKISISVKRSEIFDEVSLHSGYRVTRGQDSGDHPEKRVMRGGDRRMAQWYFDDCVACLLTSLRPFIKSVENSDNRLMLELGVEDDWSETLIGVAEAHLRGYMTKGVLGRWLETLGEESGERLAESNRELSELNAVLYHRDAPRRR